MASGFFALFDDISTLMDDVASMSKIATKKTSALLGDDLAVNAEKATGFVSSRELPVIWAITKGSFLNKLIILPLIILLSIFASWAIIPILLVGGLYLAYEGAEKIYDFLFPHRHAKENIGELKELLTKEEILAAEKIKIKSAIITDFILSLEIVIMGVSIVKDQSLAIQIPVLIFVAIATTIGVYGIVALIVRLDDIGYKLIEKGHQKTKKWIRRVGIILVKSLPVIIKVLSVVGTIAMLMVAGGIYIHNIEYVHHFFHKFPLIISEICLGALIGFTMLLIIKSVRWLTSNLLKK